MLANPRSQPPIGFHALVSFCTESGVESQDLQWLFLGPRLEVAPPSRFEYTVTSATSIIGVGLV